jgi:hypothetical protein
LVFVTVHGGNEYYPYPRPGLRKICRYFIDRGADGVICHHPHVPGAYEFYQGKPIVYSLGNLLFDHPKAPLGWNEGYAISLNYNIEKKELMFHKIIPYSQSVENGGVQKMQGEDIKKFLNQLSLLNQILSDDNAYIRCWHKYCVDKEQELLFKHFFPIQLRGMSRVARLIPWQKVIIKKSKINSRLNSIRCESHRELLLNILENKC